MTRFHPFEAIRPMEIPGVLAVNPWEEASGLDPEAVHCPYVLVKRSKYGAVRRIVAIQPSKWASVWVWVVSVMPVSLAVLHGIQSGTVVV
jgi:hypothetical protein